MTPAAMSALMAKALLYGRVWSTEEITNLLSANGCFALRHPHGFALGRAAGEEAELLMLVVDPEHQRRGIGARILADFEDGARTRCATEAHLEVSADNAPARALYQSAGWNDSGRRRNYYRRPDGQDVDAITMTKSLRHDGR